MFLDKFPYRKMPDNSNECINWNHKNMAGILKHKQKMT
jgi:hypothetical protein